MKLTLSALLLVAVLPMLPAGASAANEGSRSIFPSHQAEKTTRTRQARFSFAGLRKTKSF